jgi:repressor LexA
MNRPLTHQQQAVYNLIRDRIVHRGYGPTVREIGEHMNIKSPNGVMCHLRALERKGMIIRSANKSRAIELTESLTSLVGATLLVEGRVSASGVSPNNESLEQIDLATLTATGRHFLRVQDDSLIDAHIRSGDLVVVQTQSQATPGQLAIVRMVGGETCVRYLFAEGDKVRLQPVHRSQPTTVVDRAEVLGVIVGVVRMISPLGGMP